MSQLKAIPAIIFAALLLFAYGCDCPLSGGTPFETFCVIDRDTGACTQVTLDANGNGTFTPASGKDCSSYFVQFCDAGCVQPVDGPVT